MLDPVFVTELPQLGSPANAEPRLQRTGRVVDPRMDHAAVVPALVGGDLRFFLEDDHPDAGLAVDDFSGGRQADQARANDREVDVVSEGQIPAARRRRASETMVSTRSTTQNRVQRANQRMRSMPPEAIKIGTMPRILNEESGP